MENKAILLNIPLAEISIGKSNPRPDADLSLLNLQEISESIKINGLIHPILVRPKPNGKTKYELVCGERRFRGSKMAGLNEIPCNVRVLTDAQAEELQLIENLERKDVHPMYEAFAFKRLLERKMYDVAGLAAKFVKAESFIVARLKLNDLIPEFQKKFVEGTFTIGHATLAARLQPEDQKDLMEQKDYWSKQPLTVKEWQDYIEEEIMCVLKTASFKKEDATLLPTAGACTVCPKRSGANATLFNDVKDKDRCFDKACFKQKSEIFLLNELAHAHQTKTDIVFLSSDNNLSDVVKKFVADNKVTILKQNHHFTTSWNQNDKKATVVKGLWLNGNQAGKYAQVKLTPKGASSPANINNAVSFDEQIKELRVREERNKELDNEKIHAQIKDALRKHGPYTESVATLCAEEVIAFSVLLYDRMGYEARDYMEAVLKLEDYDFDRTAIYEKLIHMYVPDIIALNNCMIRKGIISHLMKDKDNPEKSGEALAVREIAKRLLPDKVAAAEKQQAEITTKRIVKVEARIAEVQRAKNAAKIPKAAPIKKLAKA